MNRDASNPLALRAAVGQWLHSANDEADIALEAALLDLGVISPVDAIESIEATYWEEIGITVTLEDGTQIQMNSTSGEVAVNRWMGDE
jgi:ferric-dicitrate binding protein FerR (iron transport regulator)